MIFGLPEILTIILLITIFGVIFFNLVKISRILSEIFRDGLKTYLLRRRKSFILIRFLKTFFISIVIISFVTGIAAAIYLNQSTFPRLEYAEPKIEGVWDSYTKPITVVFTVPVDNTRINENMNPMLKGQWVWEPYFGINRLSRVGRFYTDETLFPGERIVIYLTGVKRLFVDEGHEIGTVLDSPRINEVKFADPLNNSSDVELDKEVRFQLEKPISDWEEITYKISPEIKTDFKFIDDKNISIRPTEKWDSGEIYTVDIFVKTKKIIISSKELKEADNPTKTFSLKFATIKDAGVRSFAPKGSSVKQDALVKIRFEAEVDREFIESSFKITPSLEGKFEWQDNKKMTFKPSQLFEKATKYTISFINGIKTLKGMQSQPMDFAFETIGRIKLLNYSPADGTVKVPINNPISITFDQEVDKASAESHFSINPAMSGSIRWDGNTMIYEHSGFSYGAVYTVTLASGIKSLYGLDSDQDFAFGFSTRPNEIVISMPLYLQPQFPVSFSCNIYATKMALAWKGFDLSAISIIGETGYNESYNGGWRGNPYNEYVGNYDGSWGYGVYWGPVQRLFTNRGISTEIRSGMSISQLASTVEQGHPVIIWRYNGTSANYDMDWIAEDGTYVNAINGQHGGVITGFRGSADNPTHLHINDPWFGLIWMDVGTFNYYWSRLGNVGLVVY